jgi:hypothetical protein
MRLALLALLALLTLVVRDASACSCGIPPPRMLTPARGDGAPLNTKVRYGIATPYQTQTTERVELREVEGDKLVATTEERFTLGNFVVVELTPKTKLAPKTRYSLSQLRSKERPKRVVFGSFRTGTELDQKAPMLTSFGKATTHEQGRSIHSSCDTGHSYATVQQVRSKDPERGSAKLLYAVWLADKTGAVDPRRAPVGLLELSSYRPPEELYLGNNDLCDLVKFPFPAQKNVTLGIAAVDEAGNRSAVRTVNLRFSRPPPAP